VPEGQKAKLPLKMAVTMDHHQNKFPLERL